MVKVALNYPAPIPVGHRVEVTWFEDTRPEKKRGRIAWHEPYAHPVVRDLETGIVYMNSFHTPSPPLGGNSFRPNDYSLTYRADIPVREVWHARVTACALVLVSALDNQHTMLELEPITDS